MKLSLKEKHKTWLQEGGEYSRSVLQQKIWIPGLRNVLRSVKHDCFQCKKVAGAMNPQISDLPASRFEGMVYPFSDCGVHFFGPFHSKCNISGT